MTLNLTLPRAGSHYRRKKSGCNKVAREFAENAGENQGKSMILLGSGSNHWYHSDMIYRTILNLTTLCGCQGVNGGGGPTTPVRRR